jgi:hypothetical protein
VLSPNVCSRAPSLPAAQVALRYAEWLTGDVQGVTPEKFRRR